MQRALAHEMKSLDRELGTWPPRHLGASVVNDLGGGANP